MINRPFADIHKVNGLDGVYIATQTLSFADLNPFHDRSQVSVITFNKGGYWHPIPAPDTDVKGNKLCNTSTSQQVMLYAFSVSGIARKFFWGVIGFLKVFIDFGTNFMHF